MTVLRGLTSDAIMSDAATQHRELHHAVLEPGGLGAPENLIGAEMRACHRYVGGGGRSCGSRINPQRGRKA